MTEEVPEGEVYGMLLGLIEMKGLTPQQARNEVVEIEGVDPDVATELVVEHWEGKADA